jgi:protoheme IX farnesyltransferase
MTVTVEPLMTTPLAASRLATAGDYLSLMKPRVMSLVVFTALTGLLAAPGAMHPFLAAVAILAIAVGAGSAGALNMWFDHDIDAVMHRTVSRAVPSGRVPKEEALALGLIGSALSVLMLALVSGPVAAGWLAFSIFFYAVIYTQWLKRSTDQNIVIGGAAGALPPVIGWAAVTGTTPLEAWVLFGIIFLWTPPHFWALSLVSNADYARAGVPMLPVTKGAPATRRQIVAYTVALLAATAVPVWTGFGGMLWAAVAGLGGLGFFALAVRVALSRAGEADAGPADRKAAMGLFAYSIAYLFAVFAVPMVEHGLGLYWPLPQLG